MKTEKPEHEGRGYEVALDAGEHHDLLILAVSDALITLSDGDNVFQKESTATGATLFKTENGIWGVAIKRESQGIYRIVVASCAGEPEMVLRAIQDRLKKFIEAEASPDLGDLAALCDELLGSE